jgi:hypothetical protein
MTYSKNNSTTNEETEKLIRRSISLIYTLTIDPDLCKLVRNSLPDDEVIELFDELSSVSPDKHIQFTSTLISWTLNKENTANRKYSPQMIKTFVHYLRECRGDPLQQCQGLPLDSMVSTLTGTYMKVSICSVPYTRIERGYASILLLIRFRRK